MSRSVASALTVGLLLACGGARPVAAPTTGDATPLLRAMADRYAALRAYEDKGSVVMTTHHAQSAAETGPHVDFETAFDRASGGYRFELTRSYPDAKDAPEHGTIWRTTHGPAHTSFSFAPGAQETNLCTAMLDFAGSSVGASFHVPAMLAGRSVIADDSSMLRGAEFHFDGEEDVDGVPCTKVSSKDPAARASLWIGKADLSLRRISQRVGGDGNLDVTTSYSPRFEGSIDARRFTNDVQ